MIHTTATTAAYCICVVTWLIWLLRAPAEDITVVSEIGVVYKQVDSGCPLPTGLSHVGGSFRFGRYHLEMQKKVKDAGYPIATMVTYSNMGNYESVDSFLKECMEGQSGSVVIYEIHNDGGLGRMKFIFDGTDMYVVSTRGIWNADNEPGISYISYTRLKEWKYTEKGWFCYELCVPEPPEVSEIVDGSCLIRIKPMTEEQREMSERCVRGLGYQGNNLLCSNWNIENLNELDYNGMFEYLYGMKYGEKFNSEDYPNGIPKEEFESLIMEYLPITAEQIRDYAVFDEENQTYYWVRLGCFNYAPTFFGTSLPEPIKASTSLIQESR